ncbi:MAG: DUF459 domain-containing protein [Spirochaetales bacterium]|nr:DUF459 domain-containing protein [Spirochaetales bacterium]
MKRGIRFYTVQQAAVVLLLGLIISLFGNAGNIHRSIMNLDDKTLKAALLFFVTPYRDLVRPLTVDERLQDLRRRFFHIARISTDSGFAAETGEMVTAGSPPPVVRPEETSLRQGTTGSRQEPPERNAPPVFSSRRPFRLLMIGDSLLSGAIAVMFDRAVYRNRAVSSELIAHPSSGMSRTDYYNWQEKIEAVFAQHSYDALVILLGTNDAQTIVSGSKHFRFNTKSWREIYENRLTKLFRYLEGKIYRIYWIGLPPMRNSGFHAKMSAINDIIEGVCGRYGYVSFLPTGYLLGNEHARYTDYLEIDGKLSQLRLSDGIHLTYAGGKIIAGLLLGMIHRDFDFEEEKEEPVEIVRE